MAERDRTLPNSGTAVVHILDEDVDALLENSGLHWDAAPPLAMPFAGHSRAVIRVPVDVFLASVGVFAIVVRPPSLLATLVVKLRWQKSQRMREICQLGRVALWTSVPELVILALGDPRALHYAFGSLCTLVLQVWPLLQVMIPRRQLCTSGYVDVVS